MVINTYYGPKEGENEEEGMKAIISQDGFSRNLIFQAAHLISNQTKACSVEKAAIENIYK